MGPVSWVPAETVIVNRDKEQRLLVNFEPFTLEFKRRRRKEEVRCDTSKLYRKRQRQKKKKKPDVEGACHGS